MAGAGSGYKFRQMRAVFLPLLLLAGCLDLSYVDEDDSPKCDRGYDFVWTELDGGTCGSFGELVDDMTQCSATVASECIESSKVECEDGDRWSWSRDSDEGVAQVRGPGCRSRYELERR